MERRLRKGDIGEAMFREWFKRKLGDYFHSRGYTLEQQGFNPGGFVDVSEKKHLKEKSDPDFAIYSNRTGRPIVGISVNTQAKFYTVESSMGGYCCRCPRVNSCLDGREKNLWYNKYNLSDYAKFERRFNVQTCMVTLITRVDSIVKWVTKHELHDIVHAYIFDGGVQLKGKDRCKLNELLKKIRYSKGRKQRQLEIRWVLRSELEEITPEKLSVTPGKIPFWTTGGRVERGKPRPVCCVNADLAHTEQELIDFLKGLIM